MIDGSNIFVDNRLNVRSLQDAVFLVTLPRQFPGFFFWMFWSQIFRYNTINCGFRVFKEANYFCCWASKFQHLRHFETTTVYKKYNPLDNAAGKLKLYLSDFWWRFRYLDISNKKNNSYFVRITCLIQFLQFEVYCFVNGWYQCVGYKDNFKRLAHWRCSGNLEHELSQRLCNVISRTASQVRWTFDR